MRLAALTLACFIGSFCFGQNTVDDSAWTLKSLTADEGFAHVGSTFPFDETFKIEYTVSGKVSEKDIEVWMLGRSQRSKPPIAEEKANTKHSYVPKDEKGVVLKDANGDEKTVNAVTHTGAFLTEETSYSLVPISLCPIKKIFKLVRYKGQSYSYRGSFGKYLYNRSLEYTFKVDPTALSFTYDDDEDQTTITIAIGSYGLDQDGKRILDDLGSYHNYMKPKWNYYFHFVPKNKQPEEGGLLDSLQWKPVELFVPGSEELTAVFTSGEFDKLHPKIGKRCTKPDGTTPVDWGSYHTNLDKLASDWRQAFTDHKSERDGTNSSFTTAEKQVNALISTPAVLLDESALSTEKKARIANLGLADQPSHLGPNIEWLDLWYSGVVPYGKFELPKATNLEKQITNLKELHTDLYALVNLSATSPHVDHSKFDTLRTKLTECISNLLIIQRALEALEAARKTSDDIWLKANVVRPSLAISDLGSNSLIKGTTHNTVKTQQERQITLEYGLGLSWPNQGSGDLLNVEGFTYIGAQWNFRPLNTATPFRIHHYPGLSLVSRHRFSLLAGLTINNLPNREGRSGFVGSRAGVVGMGYRFNHYLRLTSGALLFKENVSASEFVAGSRLAAQPFVSLTMDVRLQGLRNLLKGTPDA